MTTFLEAMSPFASPHEVRTLGAALAGLERSPGAVVLVRSLGDAAAAGAVLTALVRTFPTQGVVAAIVGEPLVRETWAQGERLGEAHAAGEDPARELRSMLRTDPDLIALARLDEATVPLAKTANETGHELWVGVSEEAVAHAFEADVLIEVGRGPANEPRIVGLTLADPSVLVRLDPAPRLQWSYPPAPEVSPTTTRRAYLPVVTAQADGASRLGAQQVRLERGSSWPTCAECRLPLAHVVQLELSTLPDSNHRGLVQLLLCPGSCARGDERAPGVWLRWVTGELDELQSPTPSVATVGGAIARWAPVDDSEPLRCDKLFGVPGWQQGDELPLDSFGAPMELLFQLQEGSLRVGATTAGWDFESAARFAANPGQRIVDPAFPRHFSSLLTGEATAWIFWAPTRERLELAFRWQTG